MSILASQQAQAWGSIIMWVVIMVVFVYFFMIRPQKKEAKKKELSKQIEVRKCFLIRHKLLSPFAHRVQ